MKRRWIIAVGILALVALGTLLLWRSGGSEQRAVEETRRALRQQGLKTDLADFDFSTSDELRARAAALTRGEFSRTYNSDSNYGWGSLNRMEHPALLAVAGTDTAFVAWRQEKLLFHPNSYPSWPRHQPGGDLWPALRAALTENRMDLDSACEATLAGPIRFSLVARNGSAMLLPHLASLRSLAQVLGSRAVLELHDGNRDAAWTNLLASTRLVTAWDPEPAEVSHLVRYGCAAIAYDAIWQVLQASPWDDNRLARLQHEWESVDLLKGLPETEAFARACHTAICQLERQQGLGSMGITVNQVFRWPRNAWYGLDAYWRRMRYLHHGSYEDEKALLLYHRDRENELRRAVQASNWLEMRQLPGSTNKAPFQSKQPSRVQSMMNMRQISLGYLRQGYGMLGRAAETEARRRLIITAIALERYRGRHGSYPGTLQVLVPELLPKPPLDFMDGKPLRYRATADGHFVLYSVGLDCVDNDGRMRPSGRRRGPFEDGTRFGIPHDTDVVWPRPASDAEVKTQQEDEQRQLAQEMAEMEARAAEIEKEAEAERQAAVEILLAEAQPAKGGASLPAPGVQDPLYKGRPLSQLLRNRTTAETNAPALGELMTLRPVTTGAEPGTATFEVPVSYQAATNLGILHLVIDGGRDTLSRGEERERQTCERATNGNCLLGWTTTYDPPGRHALQAEFILIKDAEDEQTAVKVRGPAVLFVSTNLCQFNSAYDSFNENGATLYAKLPESNGVYSIEIHSPAGAALKTFTGRTSNGVIEVHWNLIDDHGRRFTNDSFSSVFTVTLPDSGRSQQMRGP